MRRPSARSSPSWAEDAAGDSVTVAGWTVVSRVTGLVRIAAIGAVLGPTVLGNTFQFTNSLPNLLYYGLLGGSLFTSLLVPALVHHVDGRDRAAAERIAGGFLGIAVAALLVVVPLALLLGPALLAAMAPHGTGTAEGQEGVARLLFLMFVPQVFCYAVVGTATATMNAHRRFALAAAAPAMENVGIIVVLALTAALMGQAPARLGAVPDGELLLLGLGTTGAVAAHAALQWWGARRAGVTLRPSAGWREPEVLAVIRRALPSLGQAGVLALQMVVLLAAANHVRGGVVAFQMALSFIYLAIAIGVTPMAVSALPWLSRLFVREQPGEFRDMFTRSLSLCLFVAVPAAVGSMLLAPQLSRVVAVGRMGTTAGVAAITACLLALATSILGTAVFQICSYSSYARKDTRAPLVGAVVQVLVCLAGTGLSLALLDGLSLLAGLGAAYSAGSVAGALTLWLRFHGHSRPGRTRLLPSLVRTLAAAGAMAVPVWLVGRALSSALTGQTGAALTVLVSAVLGIGTYAAASSALRAPELGLLLRSVGRRGRPRGELT